MHFLLLRCPASPSPSTRTSSISLAPFPLSNASGPSALWYCMRFSGSSIRIELPENLMQYHSADGPEALLRGNGAKEIEDVRVEGDGDAGHRSSRKCIKFLSDQRQERCTLARNDFEQTAQIVWARDRFAMYPAHQSNRIDAERICDALLLVGVLNDFREQVAPRLWLFHVRSLAAKLT